MTKIKTTVYPEKNELPKTLDLAQDEVASTTISLYKGRDSYDWIYASGVSLIEQERPRTTWLLNALAPRATDRDHVQAIAFRMYLNGITTREVSDGRVWIDGFIDGECPDLFQVPEPDWNQREGAITCDVCKNKKHIIVRKDRHTPPPNHKLFNALRGRRIKVIFHVWFWSKDQGKQG